jgi:hypothetical protein
METVPALADLLAKLEDALRLLREGQRDRPSKNVGMAMAVIEKVRDGLKPN